MAAGPAPARPLPRGPAALEAGAAAVRGREDALPQLLLPQHLLRHLRQCGPLPGHRAPAALSGAAGPEEDVPAVRGGVGGHPGPQRAGGQHDSHPDVPRDQPHRVHPVHPADRHRGELTVLPGVLHPLLPLPAAPHLLLRPEKRPGAAAEAQPDRPAQQAAAAAAARPERGAGPLRPLLPALPPEPQRRHRDEGGVPGQPRLLVGLGPGLHPGDVLLQPHHLRQPAVQLLHRPPVQGRVPGLPHGGVLPVPGHAGGLCDIQEAPEDSEEEAGGVCGHT